MRLRLTARAHRDLSAVATYLLEHEQNAKAASLVADAIERTFDRILQMPRIGKASGRAGTRELVVPRLPFTVVYRINGSDIEILTVFHTSQDPKKKRT